MTQSDDTEAAPTEIGDRTRTHLLLSLMPASMDSRRLSPGFSEYSSYQTGQSMLHRFLASPPAVSSFWERSNNGSAKSKTPEGA
jgi:hypothetical protein